MEDVNSMELGILDIHMAALMRALLFVEVALSRCNFWSPKFVITSLECSDVSLDHSLMFFDIFDVEPYFDLSDHDRNNEPEESRVIAPSNNDNK